MRLRPHPRTSEIAQALAKAAPLAGAWAGDAFRMAEAPYANARDLVSGEGASLRGQRWNPPGVRTVYACLDENLSMLEWQAQREKAGMVHRRHLPLTQVTLVASLRKVLDFRKSRVVSSFGLALLPFIAGKHRAQADGETELPAQAFGRLAAGSGLEGIIVSAAPDPTRFNLVIYVANLAAKSAVRIHGVRFLPARRLK